MTSVGRHGDTTDHEAKDLDTKDIETKELAAVARRAVRHMIKTRARHYARRPMALDVLHPGLSMAPPATLVAIAEHLVERESRSPRRWFAFGGEVTLLNARAARLLGRTARRAACRDIAPKPDT